MNTASKTQRNEPINLDRCLAASERQAAVSRHSQAMLAAAGMDLPERHWFVLTIATGMDRLALETMVFAQIEAWLPQVTVTPPRRGGRGGASRPAYPKLAAPGYLLARVIAGRNAWAALAGIAGVTGILGSEGVPLPVADGTVAEWRRHLRDDPQAVDAVTNAVKPGDKVCVKKGPFDGFPGAVDAIDDHGRAKVEILLFGRVTPVTLDLAQLAKL